MNPAARFWAWIDRRIETMVTAALDHPDGLDELDPEPAPARDAIAEADALDLEIRALLDRHRENS